MKNLIYSVLKLKKATLGPKTRISLFIKEFLKNNDIVIEGDGKIKKCIKAPAVKLVYVESATNRISWADVMGLLILKRKSQKMIVFIRDIYIEIFPEQYKGFRKKITYWANRFSYWFLTFVADELVFPTTQMGDFFYRKNTRFPKRVYSALPPATGEQTMPDYVPDFNQKTGILYLGSVSYKFSGFENFIRFAKEYKDTFNFFVLSKDKNIEKYTDGNSHIRFEQADFNQIMNYIRRNNIAFGFHSRPRNIYDDITFPLKILDFINFRLPFITDKHKPLIDLISADYPLYCKVTKPDEIYTVLANYRQKEKYENLVKLLDTIAQKNTYADRYKQITTF
jgi:hypothetical protein